MSTQAQEMLQDIAEMEMLSTTLSNPMLRLRCRQLMYQRTQMMQDSQTPLDLENLSSLRRAVIERQRKKIRREIRKQDKLNRLQAGKTRKCKMF
jgi:hypothetical protein